MKKIIFLVQCLLMLCQAFGQNPNVAGQYHLAKTNQTPRDWISMSGSAVVIKNQNGSINIKGNFVIQISETTFLKANFTAENCKPPTNGIIKSYSASGDFSVTRGNNSPRHYTITEIKVDFVKQEIKISEIDPSDSRILDFPIWVKGVAPQKVRSGQNTTVEPSQQVSKKLIGCTLQGTVTDEGTLYESSDNDEIDRATNDELGFLKSSFLVNPAFFFFDDSEGENAFSTNQQLAGSSSEDGTIAFGLGLIKSQIRLSINGTNVPVILAHEFAHTVARKYELNLPTKQNELFADYLAGGYMFYRNRNFKTTDINAAFRSFYNMGDNNFTEPDHHGTPASRYACIKQGYTDCLNAFRQGRVFSLDDGVRLGKQFVTTHDLR
ncbi:MAG: hypothetical protein ABI091_12795 [Ferruginibacter sp.]